MRVLVTGATGFVGSHVAEALVARGHEVIALARRSEAHGFVRSLGATPVSGSLEDAATLERALAGSEVVFHVAGLTAARSEAEFFAVNEGGTRRILEAIGRAAPGARCVYVSTQAALGPSQPGEFLSEDAPPRPISAYGRSKLAGEAAVRASAGPWVIVRPPVVYGPRDKEFLRLFRVTARGLNPVMGRGAQTISIVYAPDLADAIVRAGTAAGATGRTYHAAHPVPVSYRELGETFGRALGRRTLTVPLPMPVAAAVIWGIERAAWLTGKASVVSTDRLPEFREPAWLIAVTKAERELGWRAGHDLLAGARETAAWYRSRGLL
jgi:nucleoside-diphosphate-sugar epimerase